MTNCLRDNQFGFYWERSTTDVIELHDVNTKQSTVAAMFDFKAVFEKYIFFVELQPYTFRVRCSKPNKRLTERADR